MKKRFFYIAFMIFVFASMFSSCKKGSSNEATVAVANTTVAGIWSGTVVNTVEHDNFSINFTLKQTGNDITGEFSAVTAPGNVIGSMSGNSIVLTLTPAVSSGYSEVDTFKGTINSAATEITGTFNSTVTGVSGTFDIKKQ